MDIIVRKQNKNISYFLDLLKIYFIFFCLDSFFTERYIPLKGDYLRALQEADLTMKVGNIKGRNYMLIHGTADTFVHQEHSLMLARALIDQEVKFRQQV